MTTPPLNKRTGFDEAPPAHIAAVAETAAKEALAARQLVADLEKVGISGEQALVDRTLTPNQEALKHKKRQIRARVRQLTKEASQYYLVHKSDLAIFEKIALIEYICDELSNNVFIKKAYDNLRPPGGKGKSEGEVTLKLVSDLTKLGAELRAKALLTRGARHHMAIEQERSDTFTFFKDVRRKLMADAQRVPALEVEAKPVPDDVHA